MARTRNKAKGRRDLGGFYPVTHSVANTQAYMSLSAYSLKLWHDLMLQYNGHNNGRIAAILTQLEPRGWANGTLYRSLRELQEKGFLEKTRQGGLGAGEKFCTFYRFTHLPTDEDVELGLKRLPPTNEYRAWTPARK